MTNIITARDAAALLATGEAILIDVREADEFRAEHIAYAQSLPLGDLEALLHDMALPQGRIVIFQCLKGGRGMTACHKACGCGIDGLNANRVYNLEGGITAWKEAGLPLVRTDEVPSGGLSLFRQVQIIAGGLIALLIGIGFMTQATFFFLIAGIMGAMLCVAGVTGWCGLAMLLQKMPWNRS